MFDRPIRIYIICPVRRIAERPDLKEQILAYEQELISEKARQGLLCEIRVPFRDTAQDDPIGLRITDEHEINDILWADEIHIWWDPKWSEGSLWDWAQARLARHLRPEIKIVGINVEEKDLPILVPDSEIYLAPVDTKNQKFVVKDEIALFWSQGSHSTFLWMLAQARLARQIQKTTRIVIVNAKDIPPTLIKSYDNVALATHLNLPPTVTRAEFDQAVAELQK